MPNLLSVEIIQSLRNRRRRREPSDLRAHQDGIRHAIRFGCAQPDIRRVHCNGSKIDRAQCALQLGMGTGRAMTAPADLNKAQEIFSKVMRDRVKAADDGTISTRLNRRRP